MRDISFKIKYISTNYYQRKFTWYYYKWFEKLASILIDVKYELFNSITLNLQIIFGACGWIVNYTGHLFSVELSNIFYNTREYKNLCIQMQENNEYIITNQKASLTSNAISPESEIGGLHILFIYWGYSCVDKINHSAPPTSVSAHVRLKVHSSPIRLRIEHVVKINSSSSWSSIFGGIGDRSTII